MLGLSTLAKRWFGSVNERAVKQFQDNVDAINALEGEIEVLSDDALKAKSDEFRARLQQSETLDDILVEAFAVVREAAKRTLGQRHFDVQLVGGMVLHSGQIAEMKTGEGKTLVATLAVYLNALEGKGVHVVTVNDYLAQRDAGWMGQIYEFLGLRVGCVVHGLERDAKIAAYAADVTYGTNNEFGFDYLRDNISAFTVDELVQRPFNFAIVDEVDNILIDEARTPLIISGPTEDNSELYRTINKFIPDLEEDDIELDEKSKTVILTEQGTEHIEQLLAKAGMLKGENLYDIENVSIVHHVNQAVRAHELFKRDTDYIIKDDKVVIIDEFTGRMMEGRRFSEGLHQALEAKEGVAIQNENQTLASVTFQNYFRMYPKLSGMTGTAATEASEFLDIYGLGVVEIPTNVEVTRIDDNDEVYRSAREKYDAIIEQVRECAERGQPILVGTVSIEKSEILSSLLKKAKIEHSVLNARYHEQEAQIITQAGRLSAITIATNMAGRGTDIQLGGNLDVRLENELAEIPDEGKRAAASEKIAREVEEERAKVCEAGGLYVLATERHESRRIDNQLRGRSGRQGDPGRSKFYLSLEDDLMRIFGSDRMDSVLVKLGLEEGEAIVHPWINKALAKAQERVEQRNFEIRKNILKYDDVMNDQRKVVYEQRREILAADDLSDTVTDMRHDVIHDLVEAHIPAKTYAEQWDLDGLGVEFHREFDIEPPLRDWAREDGIDEDGMLDRLILAADTLMAERAVRFTPKIMRFLEKNILLQVVDQQWKDHLLQLDHLRQTVQLRAYGQRDPLNEYKSEAFDMFRSLLTRIREEATFMHSHVEVRAEEPLPEVQHGSDDKFVETRVDPATGESPPPQQQAPQAPVRTRQQSAQINPDDPSSWGKVSRNAPCPCGSGKKFKHCHGAVS